MDRHCCHCCQVLLVLVLLLLCMMECAVTGAAAGPPGPSPDPSLPGSVLVGGGQLCSDGRHGTAAAELYCSRAIIQSKLYSKQHWRQCSHDVVVYIWRIQQLMAQPPQAAGQGSKSRLTTGASAYAGASQYKC